MAGAFDCIAKGTSAPLPALPPHIWTEPMSMELKITHPLCYCKRTLLGLQGRVRTQSSEGQFPVPLRPAFPQEVLNGEIPSIPRGDQHALDTAPPEPRTMAQLGGRERGKARGGGGGQRSREGWRARSAGVGAPVPCPLSGTSLSPAPSLSLCLCLSL